MHTKCEEEWLGMKAGCLSFGVKRVKRVRSFVVGWGGCECDGLVSITLVLSMSTTSIVSHAELGFKTIVLLLFQSMCW